MEGSEQCGGWQRAASTLGWAADGWAAQKQPQAGSEQEEGQRRDTSRPLCSATVQRQELGLGPSLDVLAGQDVADDTLRILRHQTRRAIAATCEQGARSAQGREQSTRAVSCTARTGDGAARAGGGQRAVVKGSEQRAAGIRRAAEKQRQAGSEQEEGAAQTPWDTPGRQVLWREP